MRTPILILLLLASPYVGHAQQPTLPGIGNALTIEVSERDGIEPHSSVTLSARSFLIDLNRASLTWLVNGKHLEESDGNKTITVPVGAIGTETRVSLVAQGANGLNAQPEIVLRPTELELQWEGDGFAPPLYRGRTLVSIGTNIRAHAEVRFVRANGLRIPEENIIYTWTLDGVALPEASGRGRSSPTIPMQELYGDAILTVEARSTDTLFSARRSVRIPRLEPLLVLYRAHPLLGINYGAAIAQKAPLTESEITVAALPFFGTHPTDPITAYVWKVGNVTVPTDVIHPFLVTLSLADKTYGSTAIAVFLNNTRDALRSVERVWSVELSTISATEDVGVFFPQEKE